MVTVGQCQYIYNLHRGCCNTRNEFSSIYYPIETIIYIVNNINNDYGEQKRVLLIYYNLYIIIRIPSTNAKLREGHRLILFFIVYFKTTTSACIQYLMSLLLLCTVQTATIYRIIFQNFIILWLGKLYSVK